MTNGCPSIIAGERCGKIKSIVPIYFFDPTNPGKVISALNCQLHRNGVIEPYLKIYKDLQKTIQIAKGDKEKKRRKARSYEIYDDPDVIDKFDLVIRDRRKHTTEICRDPSCNKHLDALIYTAISFGQNGRVAHELRFHKDCWILLQRKLGLFEMLTAQTKLVP